MCQVQVAEYSTARPEVHICFGGHADEAVRLGGSQGERATGHHGVCSFACPYCPGECVRHFDHQGPHQCYQGHNW